MNAMNEFTAQIFAELETGNMEGIIENLTEREAELCKTLEIDVLTEFIKFEEDNVWHFQQIGGIWKTRFLGKPMYYLDPVSLGHDDIDVQDVLEDLRKLLPGVTVEVGTSLQNYWSDFVDEFHYVLQEAKSLAIEKHWPEN